MEVPRLDFPKLFGEVCCGNSHALEFCQAFAHWVHLVDDYIDRDKPADPDVVIRVNLEVLRVFSFNPFWKEHSASLFPLMLQAMQAWSDSIRWAQRPDFRDRATSDVLKSQYQDVWFHVAYLCGGYDHMKALTQKYRVYDYETTG